MTLATYSVLTFAILLAQSPATVSFDAASIKLNNNSGQRSTSMRVLPGGARRGHQSANTTVTPEQVRVMMRALLADRFKLQWHTEQREMPKYAMRLARPGGRLGDGIKKPSDDARGGVRASDGSLTTQRTTMAALVRELTDYAGRPVVDETGLAGEWALTVTWMPDVAGGDSNSPSIFTAMREQLGLKLEPVRGPVDVLVIDRAARPSED